MSNIPLPGQIYKHFKGNLYKIVTLAEHSETGEKLVVYQALYGDYSVYARPLSMFCEKVNVNKYPEAIQEHRFELQKKLDINASSIEIKDKDKEEIENIPEKVFKEEADNNTTDNNTTDNNTTEYNTADCSEDTEECNLDPLVMEFLDTKSYETRINILAALHHRITDDMITTMAMAADLEVPEGDTEQRFEELKQCLLTFEKYEGCRLR